MLRASIIFGVVLFFACGSENTLTVNLQPPSTTCTDGTLGCPCDPVNACKASLTCDQGFCVPATCARGAENCACYANATCDSLDGVPMTCASNLCVASELPADGTLGGSCAAAPCATGLVCERGRCDDPSCPIATLGCTCGAFGQCQSIDDRQPQCVDGRCALGACEPGSAGCTCAPDDVCDVGFECQTGICRTGSSIRVVVHSPIAEACDILLVEQPERRVADVRFESHIQGERTHRSPELALSFITREPGPAGHAVTLHVALPSPSASPLAAAVPTVRQALCYDSLGRPIANSQVTLE